MTSSGDTPRTPGLVRQALLVAGKDLRIEARSRVALNQVLPFAGIVLLLLFGNGPRDPLFIQVKQELPSCYAPYLKPATPVANPSRMLPGGSQAGSGPHNGHG